jgi:hypothetical protein
MKKAWFAALRHSVQGKLNIMFIKGYDHNYGLSNDIFDSAETIIKTT